MQNMSKNEHVSSPVVLEFWPGLKAEDKMQPWAVISPRCFQGDAAQEHTPGHSTSQCKGQESSGGRRAE